VRDAALGLMNHALYGKGGTSAGRGTLVIHYRPTLYTWGPIYKISDDNLNDYLTIMPKLQLTYDGRLVCKTSHEERKALRYDLLAKSQDCRK